MEFMLLVMISIKLCLWFERINKINAAPIFRAFIFILIDDLFMQHMSKKKRELANLMSDKEK